MFLHNRINRKELEERLINEPFRRNTLSFYKYTIIENPQQFRDHLYRELTQLNCLGRIYIAREGINAQMSVPEFNKECFIQFITQVPGLEDVPLKWAVDDDGKSFFKLTIKIRHKLVADGLEEGTFDVTNVGNHLNALEFHQMLNHPDTLVVDMRNHYESEIGRFENAICADSDTFSEGIIKIKDRLNGDKDKNVLLYCTGGIRCEKASAYLKHHGFNHVNQLYGGIIEYANTIKALGLKSKFNGKNFVFDRRLGEDIDGMVISRCHQCGLPANRHVNCANNDCHLLFIQCDACAEIHDGCCCDDCMQIKHLPEEERKKLRPSKLLHYSKSKIFNRGILSSQF
jgi:UPF0176 protein